MEHALVIFFIYFTDISVMLKHNAVQDFLFFTFVESSIIL